MKKTLAILAAVILLGCQKEKKVEMCSCEEQTTRAIVIGGAPGVGGWQYYSHSLVTVDCERDGEEVRWYDQPYTYRKVIACP